MSRYALRSNLAALAIAVAGAMGRAPCLPRRRSMAARRTPCMKAATTASTGMHDGVYFPAWDPCPRSSSNS